MNFHNWLLQIGKSERTAHSYSRAISGVISNWVQETGLNVDALDEIDSVSELIGIFDGLNNVDIYVDRNAHGNNMYSCAFKLFIEYRKCDVSEDLEQDVESIINDDSIVRTEKTTYINARIGQGKYRNKLIGYWEQCALTGFKDVRFLVASHIKPWRASDNTEKLDPFNGLLLLPNLDKVFDLGFITFSKKGNIIISKYLEETEKLGITENMSLKLEDRHLPYMKYYRNNMYESKI